MGLLLKKPMRAMRVQISFFISGNLWNGHSFFRAGCPMKRRNNSGWACILCCGLLLCVGTGGGGFPNHLLAQERTDQRINNRVISPIMHPRISVIVETTTWKTRGRVLYDVEGTIRKKLSGAGFRTGFQDLPSTNFELSVTYRERRGPQYGVGLWGTTIHATFEFRGETLKEPYNWEVVETSTNLVSGTPPYLDALMKFETQSFYYFLGPMLQELMAERISLDEALQRAVLHVGVGAYPLAHEKKMTQNDYQDQYMESSQSVFQDVAFQRAIDELLKKPGRGEELVPLAWRILDSFNSHLRVRAVEIFGRTGQSPSTLRKLMTDDPHPAVREAAQKYVAPSDPTT